MTMLQNLLEYTYDLVSFGFVWFLLVSCCARRVVENALLRSGISGVWSATNRNAIELSETVVWDSIARTSGCCTGAVRYLSVRIPAIVRTMRGTLLAFAEGRVNGRSDAGKIHVLLKRSCDNGQTWSDEVVVWADGDNTCGNPALVVDESNGTICLAMTWNLGADTEANIMAGCSSDVRHCYMTKSTDDGETWATPWKISDTCRRPYWPWYATGPGNVIQLTHGPQKGRLVIPCNHSDHSDESRHPYRSHTIYSDDHGSCWTLLLDCQVLSLNLQLWRHEVRSGLLLYARERCC